MSPRWARWTKPSSSKGLLAGAAFSGGSTARSTGWAFRGAGSLMVRVVQMWAAQGVGLFGEIFSQAEQARLALRFRQAVQGVAGGVQILVHGLARRLQGLVGLQESHQLGKMAGFPILNQCPDSRPFAGLRLFQQPQQWQSEFTLRQIGAE